MSNLITLSMGFLGFAGLGVAITAALMADLAADAQRRGGQADKNAPGLYGFTVQPFGIYGGFSVSRVFSRWYEHYQFSFIRRCTYIARVGLLLATLVPLSIAAEIFIPAAK